MRGSVATAVVAGVGDDIVAVVMLVRVVFRVFHDKRPTYMLLSKERCVRLSTACAAAMSDSEYVRPAVKPEPVVIKQEQTIGCVAHARLTTTQRPRPSHAPGLAAVTEPVPSHAPGLASVKEEITDSSQMQLLSYIPKLVPPRCQPDAKVRKTEDTWGGPSVLFGVARPHPLGPNMPSQVTRQPPSCLLAQSAARGCMCFCCFVETEGPEPVPIRVPYPSPHRPTSPPHPIVSFAESSARPIGHGWCCSCPPIRMYTQPLARSSCHCPVRFGLDGVVSLELRAI